MQVVGFNLKKISAEKFPDFKPSAINTNIEFIELDKDKSDILKESDLIKLTFAFTVNYGDKDKKNKAKHGQVLFEGIILISTDKEESKIFSKSWKKREIPPQYTIPLYNFILRKCSIKAMQLEDDIGLPTHTPLPQLQPKKE